MISKDSLEKMIVYLFYFSLLLFGAMALGLTLELIKFGLNFFGINNPL